MGHLVTRFAESDKMDHAATSIVDYAACFSSTQSCTFFVIGVCFEFKCHRTTFL